MANKVDLNKLATQTTVCIWETIDQILNQMIPTSDRHTN